jgi:hypothetical protein
MPTLRDQQRYARKGTTTQRGYGNPHQCTGKQRRAAWRPGDPCAHCGRPIWQLWRIDGAGRRISTVDLPHNADRTGYLPGLAHAHCNRSEAASRGNRQRVLQPARWAVARRW